MPGDLTALAGAFLAGLLGSGHCMAMCGGIAGTLGALAARPSARNGWPAALQFNVGRLAGYSVLGAAAGGLLGIAGRVGQLPAWGVWLRALTAVLILAMGLHYLLGWRGLETIERAGSRVWGCVAPVAARAGARGDAAGRLVLGLCWGFLPCGLVYTVLLMAAASGGPLAGLVIMLAFGAGTLPAMLGLTLAAPALAGLLSDRTFRRFIGFSLVLLAAWMAFTLWLGAAAGAHRH